MLKILRMDSGDEGTTGAVAVAMSARKKQGKKAPGGLKTLKVLNNFGPAGRCNPPRAAKVDSGVHKPEFAGGTPNPHKKAQGKEASCIFHPNRKKASAAAKGGRDVEADAIAEDDSDDDKGASVVIRPNREKVFAAARGRHNAEAKAVTKDDLDDDEGASVGRPRRKTRAIKGGRVAMVLTGWPKARQDPEDPADRAGNGLPEAGPAKVPPESGCASPLEPPSAGTASPSRSSTKMAQAGMPPLQAKMSLPAGRGATSVTQTKTLWPRHDSSSEAGPATRQWPRSQGSRAP